MAAKFLPDHASTHSLRVLAEVSGRRKTTTPSRTAVDDLSGRNAEWSATLLFNVDDVAKDFAVLQLRMCPPQKPPNDADPEDLIGLVALPVSKVFDTGEETRWFELLDRCVFVCMCVRVCICILLCWTCVYCVRIYVCMYMYTYIHIHAYINTGGALTYTT
jgi:hypothetical protein